MRDEIAAYAIGALGEREAATIERHLAECEECAAYARWLEPAVDQLPASVPQLEPPSELGKRLAETVRADAQRLRAGEGARGAARWRSWRGITWRPATALAALAVLALGAVGGWLMRDPGPDPETITASLERDRSTATLHVESAPKLADDDVYQVWVQRKGVMNPSSTFAVSEDGNGEAVIDESLRGAEAVLVTSEPNGGSTTPSSPPILRTPLE
jgi:anti-sigma-K factor RskA